MFEEMLRYNRNYVEEKKYEEHQTDKFPDKKTAIVTCMDTRLTRLLPEALNLKNGDVKMIKNAGGIFRDPFGGEVRSLLIAVYELGVEHIMVIGHTNCGVEHLKCEELLEQMELRGISKQTLEEVKKQGIDYHQWLDGFDKVDEAVMDTVHLLRNHPLFPKDITVHGYVIDIQTGLLMEIEEKNQEKKMA